MRERGLGRARVENLQPDKNYQWFVIQSKIKKNTVEMALKMFHFSKKDTFPPSNLCLPHPQKDTFPPRLLLAWMKEGEI